MSYHHVDHRAPRYLPRTDPVVAVIPLTLIGAAFVGSAAVLIPLAIVVGGVFLYSPAVAAFLALLRWLQVCKRYVVRIPDSPGLESYDANKALTAISGHYRDNPDLREVIEPVLIASYDLARHLRVQALRERQRAVQELVAEANAGAVNNADLTELRAILDIRREMRRDGLL